MFGGYALPFVSIGVFGVSGSIAGAILMLPHTSQLKTIAENEYEDKKEETVIEEQSKLQPNEKVENTENEKRAKNVMSFFLAPKMVVLSFSYVLACSILGVTLVYLAPFIRDILHDIDEDFVGVFFLVSALTSATIFPAIGALSDRNYTWMMFTSCPLFGLIDYSLFGFFIIEENAQLVIITVAF